MSQTSTQRPHLPPRTRCPSPCTAGLPFGRLIVRACVVKALISPFPSGSQTSFRLLAPTKILSFVTATSLWDFGLKVKSHQTTSVYVFHAFDRPSLLDPHLLTVGQLQWMDYELFLPALGPLFLSNNLPIPTVDRIIKEAQKDLYFPSDSLSTHLHIAYASKCF